MSKIINLSPTELRQLQLIELEMLIEIDRICQKCDINYTLDGGTLLGAVRHGGFIPWDDDLDVLFLHEEYEKFYEACKIELDTSRFFFQDYRTDPNYRWGYGKLRRNNTEYIKYGQEKLKQKTGVCIDIFDYENMPNGKRERKRYIRKMFCIRKILYSALGKTNEKKLVMRLWYSILSIIPNKWVHRLKEEIASKYNNAETENVLCMMWPVKNRPFGYPRVLFSDYVELQFEGMGFKAMKGYKQYLEYHYGDYMQLPPEKERHGVMDAVELKLIDVTIEELKKIYLKGRLEK